MTVCISESKAGNYLRVVNMFGKNKQSIHIFIELLLIVAMLMKIMSII